MGKQSGLSMWAVPLSYFCSCGQLRVSSIFRNVAITSSGWDHKAPNSFIVFRTGILFPLVPSTRLCSSPDVSPLLVKQPHLVHLSRFQLSSCTQAQDMAVSSLHICLPSLHAPPHTLRLCLAFPGLHAALGCPLLITCWSSPLGPGPPLRCC